MSINRLNPAACNNTLEIAPALANLNFDFSLYKVEAPKEFIGVGSHLSTMRREKAENGQAHMTARRLGALFEAILPPVPVLMKSYGQRASEISQVSSLTSETRKQYRMFSDQLGTDATSIWAAATSGTAAIAVHLLACLLARMFDAAEATSIWVELVHKRKEAIQSQFDETNSIHMSSLQATRQIIARSQLAEWDASARAWLRMADQVKRRQHTQLKLVMDNIDLSVNKIPETYESVIEAWTSCLMKVEGLLKGLAQQAGQGDILLATSAWHLYPDMVVIAPSKAHIHQSDPLFQNQALLTVGLELPYNRKMGVSWSLPLKYLRHYGAPVTERSLLSTTERSRLSVDEFMFVVLGCIIAKDSAAVPIAQIINCFSRIFNMIEQECIAGSLKARALIEGNAEYSWISLVLRIAVQYSHTADNDRLVADKLIALGRRHEHYFLGVPSDPMFGLMSDGEFIGVLSDVDSKLQHLREVAHRHFEHYEYLHVIILHKGKLKSWELASAIPFPSASRKRASDGQFHVDFTQAEHTAWVYGASFQQRPFGSEQGYFDIEWSRLESVEFCDFHLQNSREASMEYKYWYGDLHSAALFVTRSSCRRRVSRAVQAKTMYGLLETEHCNPQAVVNKISIRLRSHFDFMTARFPDPYDNLVHQGPFSHRMRGIATIVNLYKTLPSATINVNILSQPLETAKWLSLYNKGEYTHYSALFDNKHPQCALSEIILPMKIDRPAAFACIAMLETGRHTIDPTIMTNVMAISHEDSLYISSALLRDPSSIDLNSQEVVRLSGNIGRSGISFLVPPLEPLIREVNISEWPSLEENDFDGNMLDSFSDSSLHLSFTGAEAPLYFDFSGAQDEDAHTIETVISLHEKGKWVADLNPWKALDNSLLTKLHPCSGQFQHDSGDFEEMMTSVNSWLQLLDEHMGMKMRIIQSKGNSEARFAAMCLSVAIGSATMILPENPCWKCLEMKLHHDQGWDEGEQRPVLIA